MVSTIVEGYYQMMIAGNYLNQAGRDNDRWATESDYVTWAGGDSLSGGLVSVGQVGIVDSATINTTLKMDCAFNIPPKTVDEWVAKWLYLLSVGTNFVGLVWSAPVTYNAFPAVGGPGLFSFLGRLIIS
ncbi:MAG: hypothetical protein IIA60_07055 [Candidatus Marinimicrobia bacterium]|nr:hypothetical protein [Candidatus Neomarinimicrobiota bacterium]